MLQCCVLVTVQRSDVVTATVLSLWCSVCCATYVVLQCCVLVTLQRSYVVTNYYTVLSEWCDLTVVSRALPTPCNDDAPARSPGSLILGPRVGTFIIAPGPPNFIITHQLLS